MKDVLVFLGVSPLHIIPLKSDPMRLLVCVLSSHVFSDPNFYSMEEAKKNMYAFSTTTYTGFQCTVSEETSEKFKGQHPFLGMAFHFTSFNY